MVIRDDESKRERAFTTRASSIIGKCDDVSKEAPGTEYFVSLQYNGVTWTYRTDNWSEPRAGSHVIGVTPANFKDVHPALTKKTLWKDQAIFEAVGCEASPTSLDTPGPSSPRPTSQVSSPSRANGASKARRSSRKLQNRFPGRSPLPRKKHRVVELCVPRMRLPGFVGQG